jgi:hypothetical protein
LLGPKPGRWLSLTQNYVDPPQNGHHGGDIGFQKKPVEASPEALPCQGSKSM